MIIDRYISKEIFITLLATTPILLLIFICGQLLSYLRNAANGHLSLDSVFLLLSLQIPVLLAILLPLSLYIGVLLAYGRFYADSEAIVLYASGVSQTRLFKIALCFALFITTIIALLSFLLAPKMEEITARVLSANKSEALQLLVPGRFSSIAGSKWVFYVENITKDSKRLQNIFAAQEPAPDYTHNGQQMLGVLFSKSGYQKTDAHGNKYLILQEGNRYNGKPGNKDYQIINFREYGTRLDQTSMPFRADEKMLKTKNLLQKRNEPKMAAELNWRISLPISALILVLCAVPLSRINPQHGRYTALIPATLLYIIYVNLLFLGRTWLTKSIIPLTLGMWWVHLIMLCLALILIAQQAGWQNSKILIKTCWKKF